MTPARAHAPLCLSDLESHDPRARHNGRQRRFLCPLCGDDKPHDGAHRSLVLDADTGAWHCHRCDRGGLLLDRWRQPDASPPPRTVRAGSSPRKPTPPPPPPAPLKTSPLDDTAIGYLERRGISRALAERNDVRVYVGRYARHWLVFGMRDGRGQLVAVQSRRTQDNTTHDHYAHGPKGFGLFAARPLERPWSRVNVVVEAPFDALSVAAAGLVGLATAGTRYPTWLPRVLAMRGEARVLLGHDADSATSPSDRKGDEAAAELAAVLTPLGLHPIRCRPVGAKDWNAVLAELGADEVCRQLRTALDVPMP